MMAEQSKTGGGPSPAWVESELADPHANAEKAGKVRGMFGAIARSYDLNNRLHSLWQDQRWRRVAVRLANVRDGEKVLDVACGTGDLAGAFARTGASAVTGVDFTREMLQIARRKMFSLAPEVSTKLTYAEGDAQDLKFSDQSFDVVSIAFGIRNVASPEKALAEFARVLRPGGRLVVLEFAEPRNALLRALNHFYSGVVMPRTATWVSGDRSGAYKYLPKSIGTFWTREQMAEAMRRAGFEPVTTRDLTFGVCACHVGIRTKAEFSDGVGKPEALSGRLRLVGDGEPPPSQS